VSVVGGFAHRRPVPRPDARSQGFWDAAREERLVVQQCRSCGWMAYPPDVLCPNCLSKDRQFRWCPLEGHGVLRSWTVVRTALLPGFAPDVPYVVAVAEMPEQPGLRLTARLEDGPGPGLVYGAAVTTEYASLDDDMKVPVFRLAGS